MKAKVFLIFYTCFSSIHTYAEFLPVVSEDFFAKGSYWIWDYYKKSSPENIYSSEKYEVSKKEKNIITLIISTRNNSDLLYKKHHKIVVDLEKCLDSYANKVHRVPWRVRTYYYQNKWVEYHIPSTKIFEEKFNCDPHVRHKKTKTHYQSFHHPSLGVLDLFAQVKFNILSNVSWFLEKEGGLQGVLIRKNFNQNKENEYHSLLVDFGRM